LKSPGRPAIIQGDVPASHFLEEARIEGAWWRNLTIGADLAAHPRREKASHFE